MPLLFTLWLAARVLAIAPYLRPEVAYQHAALAIEVSGSDVSAELVLTIAWKESRYVPHAVSRVENGERTGGGWPFTTPAGGGPRYCGVMQTWAGHSWPRCLALRDLRMAYQLGAKMLRDWVKDQRGDLVRALNGYACGYVGPPTGCRGYAVVVLALARQHFRWTP